MSTRGFVRLGNQSLALVIETTVHKPYVPSFEAQSDLVEAATTFGLLLDNPWREALVGLFKQCKPHSVGVHSYRDFALGAGWPLDLQLDFIGNEIEKPLRKRILAISEVLERASLACYRPQVVTLTRADGSIAIISTERLFGPRRSIAHAMTLRRRRDLSGLTTHGQLLAERLLAEGSITKLTFGGYDTHPNAPTFVPVDGVDMKTRLAAVLDEDFGLGIS